MLIQQWYVEKRKKLQNTGKKEKHEAPKKQRKQIVTNEMKGMHPCILKNQELHL